MIYDNENIKSIIGMTIFLAESRYDITGYHFTEDAPPMLHLHTHRKNFVFDGLGEFNNWVTRFGPLLPTKDLPKKLLPAPLGPAPSGPAKKEETTVVVRNATNEPFSLSTIDSDGFKEIGKMQLDLLRQLAEANGNLDEVARKAKALGDGVKRVLETVDTEIRVRKSLEKLPGQ